MHHPDEAPIVHEIITRIAIAHIDPSSWGLLPKQP